MSQYKAIFGRFFRYGVVGGFGTVIHLVIIFLFVEYFKLTPIVSSVAGFFIVLVVSYFLNRFWTFQTKNTNRFQFIKYVIVSVIGLVINISIMYITIDILLWPYLLGAITMSFFVALTNFILNQVWTFNNNQADIKRS
jgi:putative flippase GtrA